MELNDVDTHDKNKEFAHNAIKYYPQRSPSVFVPRCNHVLDVLFHPLLFFTTLC